MSNKIIAIRQAVADYMQSEGCSCCQDYDLHKEHTKILAKLLNVPKYVDGSGYDFGRFITKPILYDSENKKMSEKTNV